MDFGLWTSDFKSPMYGVGVQCLKSNVRSTKDFEVWTFDYEL